MKLYDIQHGPEWVVWVVLGVCFFMTALFFSGRGSGLIAGFNTLPEKEKAKYDQKKLCRVYGAGFAFLDILILVMALGEKVLPAWFVYVALAAVLVDVAGMILVGNLKCKKR